MQVNHKRVQRLMTLMGLRAVYPEPKTTQPGQGHKIYPYLLRGLAIVRPLQVWSTDITYVPMRNGFMYLVVQRMGSTPGLRACQCDREQASRPLQERLDVINDLINGNATQLERLLDLCLLGDIPRDLLDERRNRLTQTIAALKKEEGNLLLQLQSQSLTDAQIENLQRFAEDTSQGLEQAEDSFEKRLLIINELDVRATLAVEDGQKIIHARCILREATLSAVTSTSSGSGHKLGLQIVICTRIVLPKTTCRHPVDGDLRPSLTLSVSAHTGEEINGCTTT